MKLPGIKAIKRSLHSVGSAILALIFAAALIAGCIMQTQRIRGNARDSAYATLRDVSIESAKTVTAILKSRVAYLQSLCMQLRNSEPSQRASIIMQHQERSGLYGFDWVGGVDQHGNGIKSSGMRVNLVTDELFHFTMEGNIGIALREVKGNDLYTHTAIVLTIPVYKEGQGNPAGCLYQTFTPDAFSELLEVGAFGAEAYIALIDMNCTVLASTDAAPLSVGENLDERLQPDERNNTYVAALRELVLDPYEGGGRFWLDGAGWYNYFTPITLRSGDDTITVGVLSLIPEELIQSRISQVFSSVMALIGMVTVGVLLLSAYIVWATGHNKRELEHLAYRDIVTGKDNYEAFKRDYDRLREKKGVHLICDIRDFMMINRFSGTARGDQVLKALGEYFDGLKTPAILAARMSDDNFVLFYAGMMMDRAEEKCNEVYDGVYSLLQDMKIASCTPAIGCCYVDGSISIERCRSMAMFAKSVAKREGARYWLYDDATATQLIDAAKLINSFEEAMEQERIEVWYQPKHHVRGGCIGGAEALARWRAPDGSLISPGRFIPVLEQHGMISDLDEYVFRRVCRELAQWSKMGKRPVPVSINISRSSLVDPELPQRYRRIVEETGADMELILLEITEDSVRRNILPTIEALRAEGFRLLMDDFGKGISNLANLRRDLFCGVKFDKSLIELIGTGEEDLLSGSLKMIRGLGISVTAEGVETQSEANYLASLDCDEIQGFFYHRPMPSESFEKLIA